MANRRTSLAILVLVGACSSEGGPSRTYEFQSRFDDTSSVSYSGQTFRHVLIADMSSYLSGLTRAIDNEELSPQPGDVMADLLFYYEFDSAVGGDVDIRVSAELPLVQSTYNDIATGKNLVDKIAGHDSLTDHADWSTAFIGAEPGTTPDELVRSYISAIDALAAQRASGNIPTDPTGAQISEVYVDAFGHDYRQLTQKFLLGAVTLSQALDDYLDTDVVGKGILAPNTRDENAPYTVLEHAWDEGFGYFGASRAYLEQTDDEIADGVAFDANGDGMIDLLSEVNFGVSVNAAKRDRGSSESAPTDFTQRAFYAFVEGRQAIARMPDEPRASDVASLSEYCTEIDLIWETAIAATIVHYINDTIADMDSFDGDYSYLDHAKHWSEMKGFALGLQFSPRMPLTDAEFANLHDLLGDAPVLSNAETAAIESYRADLLSARQLLADAYAMDPANVEAW